MRINVLGGGPAGLYFAYLAKSRRRELDIHVRERNAREATFGFGVVLAGRGLARLKAADAEIHARLMRIIHPLEDQEIVLEGVSTTIEGAPYGGAVERLRLLALLQDLCREVGVRVTYEDEVTGPSELEDADLVVGADGANSTLRRFGDFGTRSTRLSNAFAWYGAQRAHDRPSLSFRTGAGGAFCAHYYPYADDMCTFVMECDGAAWGGEFGRMGDAARQAFVEELYADELHGGPLISNASRWSHFEAVRNARWVDGRAVLIGDAARRAHFSIGSGTRIAMEDAIALASALEEEADVAGALARYVEARKPSADKLIDAARESYTWYEDMGAHMAAADGVLGFALDYLTRTSRVDLARVAADFPAFLRAVEAERVAT